MSDIMNEYADLVAEVTRLKAELEECKSPIMTHDQKISYWEDEHKKTLADCDRYRALFEKMREALEDICNEEVATMRGDGLPEHLIGHLHPELPKSERYTSRVMSIAEEAIALFDAEPRDEDYKSVPGKNVGTFKLTRIDAKGAGAMTPCECSHGKSWHVPSGANRPGQAQSCRHPFCECEEYKEKP